MKKITAIFTLFALTFISCGDDDSSSTAVTQMDPNSADITGKWYQVQERLSGTTQWMPLVDEYTCERSYVLISPANSYDTYTNSKATGTCIENTDDGTYTRNSKWVTVTDSFDYTYTYEILSIDSGKMHIRTLAQSGGNGDPSPSFEMMLTRN